VIGAVPNLRVIGGPCAGQEFPGVPYKLRHGDAVYRLAVDEQGALVYVEASKLPSETGRPEPQLVQSSAPKRRPWRVRNITPDLERGYLALLRRGATLTGAAQELGVGYPLFLRHRQAEPEFAAACRRARGMEAA
jgi:hypothetical protein